MPREVFLARDFSQVHEHLFSQPRMPASSPLTQISEVCWVTEEQRAAGTAAARAGRGRQRDQSQLTALQAPWGSLPKSHWECLTSRSPQLALRHPQSSVSLTYTGPPFPCPVAGSLC